MYHSFVTRQKPNKMHHCEISFQMHLCETKKHTFFTQKGVTNTIVRQTNKTLEKATQKVKAEVITRRRACALLALKRLWTSETNLKALNIYFLFFYNLNSKAICGCRLFSFGER